MNHKTWIEGKSILRILGIHAIGGIVFAFFPGLTFYWQMLVIFYGLVDIVRSGDARCEAAIWSAYLAGMEVFLRMTGQTVFWEFGKYSIVLFLTIGIVISKYPIRMPYLLYFILLVPSIFIGRYVDYSQARDMISFNLSGPLCLAISGIYFYKRKFSGNQFVSVIRAFGLPVIAMISYLLIQTPDLDSIAFSADSNFSVSGNYGPNQVSLLFGICIFFMVVLWYHGESFSGLKFLDYFIIAVLVFRALITFSRGGVLGAALAIGIFILLNSISGYGSRRFINTFMVSLFIVTMGVVIWSYTNTLTENALEYRYAGINMRTGKAEEYSTGRLLIMRRDWNTFVNNPVLGVGPGLGKIQKFETLKWAVTAHTEWTRMLAEHGVFGLGALLILILFPFTHFFSVPQGIRPFLFAIFVLAIFSMFHAAMRLSIIAFIYSLCLIDPNYESNPVRRQ